VIATEALIPFLVLQIAFPGPSRACRADSNRQRGLPERGETGTCRGAPPQRGLPERGETGTCRGAPPPPLPPRRTRERQPGENGRASAAGGAPRAAGRRHLEGPPSIATNHQPPRPSPFPAAVKCYAHAALMPAPAAVLYARALASGVTDFLRKNICP
jgi:hypothetical protein